MKLSRSIGRTYTSFQKASDKQNDQTSKVFKRGHKTNRAGVEGPSASIDDLAEFLKTDPKMVIRQSVSVIDKILNKKENIRHMPKCLIVARDALGQALRTYYRTQGHPAGDSQFEGYWDWKLHPYSKGGSLDEDLSKAKSFPEVLFSHEDKVSQGRWKKSFWMEKNGEPNYAAIAIKIYKHLFVSRFRLVDGQVVTNQQADNSMIAHRSRAIEKSVFKKRNIQDVDLNDPIFHLVEAGQNRDTAVGVYWSEFDLAAEIYEQCLSFEKNLELVKSKKRTRISNSDVGKLLYQHFGRVLGYFTSKIAMEEGIDPKEVGTDEVPGYDDFLHLHQYVKEFYSNIVKKSKRGRNEPGQKRQLLSSRLPSNNRELQRCLKKRKANSIMMNLIRHGRFEYYTCVAAQDGNPAPDGYFWTSEGQAEIKRLEAVSRAWRTAMIQAQRTLQSWADPENKFCLANDDGSIGEAGDYDVLTSEVIDQLTAPDAAHEKNHKEKIPLLFGKHASLFRSGPGQPRDLSKPALELCLRGLAGLRNDLFHFSNLKSFMKKTENMMGNPNNLIKTNAEDRSAVIDVFDKILTADNAQRPANVLKDVDAFEIRKFATKEQLGSFIEQVVDTSGVPKNSEKQVSKRREPVTLPRFNKVLARWENVRGHVTQDARAGLPDAARFSGLQDQWANCKFNSAKLLYETKFRAWLSSADETVEQKVRDHLNAAREQSTMLARKPQGNTRHATEVQSQSFKFGDIDDGESLAHFFARVDAIGATENRDNERYEPNREAAASKSKWIMDFKCDFFALMFADFLGLNGQEWILELSAKTEPTKGTYEFAMPPVAKGAFEPWLANFYAILHLIPIDDVSRLLHQLRKSAVLGRKVDKDPAVSEAPDPVEFENLIVLFLDMYDDKFDGAATGSSIAPFKELFDESSQFEQFYATTADGDHLLQSTQRGLRRILRHGDFGVLKRVFSTSKVSREDVKFYTEMTTASDGHLTQIARLQRERKDEIAGSNSLSKDRQLSSSDPRIEPYMKKVNDIKAFRDVASKIRLADHVEVHSIMTRVLARMIDYFGTLERDQLFVFLALRTMQINGPTHYLLADVDESPKLNGNLKHRQMVVELKGQYQKYFVENFTKEAVECRNEFCHFDVLKHDGNGREKIGISNWINVLRNVLSYDRKLKNSVAKSVIDLFEKEGFEMSLEFRDHLVHQATIEPKAIRHLKNAKHQSNANSKSEEPQPIDSLMEKLKSDSLLAMVRQLM